MSEIDERAARLAAQPYAFSLTEGEDGVYTVQVLELPGAISEGDTPSEALANGRDALTGVIAAMLETRPGDSGAAGRTAVLGDDPAADAAIPARACRGPRPP